MRFCNDKNGCFHKTLKRMATKPKYYLLCTNPSNCTMQTNEPISIDLKYIDVPDTEDDL